MGILNYPIYVISKGRWESRQTIKALDKLSIPHYVVVEPQEKDNYAQYVPVQRILELPFSNLGQGSIPARNWVWNHSVNNGDKRHWILDDNIREFYHLTRNYHNHITNGYTFKAIEDFSDRYKNVALAGMNYLTFVRKRIEKAPIRLNTRVYSCTLILNEIPYRWRGTYNEDTDLSLRALKDGWCTALFNAFTMDKATTMKMKGGNTDELYVQDDSFDGRLEMARSLKKQHPDVVKIVNKWSRWHHEVNYKPFKKNKLIRDESVEIKKGVNNYGMVFKKDGEHHNA